MDAAKLLWLAKTAVSMRPILESPTRINDPIRVAPMTFRIAPMTMY